MRQLFYFGFQLCYVQSLIFLVIFWADFIPFQPLLVVKTCNCIPGCKLFPYSSLFHLLWCWKRLLRVPWTARRSNQSILKEIRPGCSLEGLMLKLKLQYFGHLMRRADSFEKTLMLGKIEGRMRRG